MLIGFGPKRDEKSERHLVMVAMKLYIVSHVHQKTRRNTKAVCTPNYLLVEAIPTPKGPRQKVICSLGDLRPRPAEEWLLLVHKVEDALVGQQTIYESRDPEVEKIVRRVRRREQQEKESTEKQQDAHEAQSAADDVVSVRTDGVRTEQHRKAGSIHVGVEFWRRLDLDNILAEAGFDERARKITCRHGDESADSAEERTRHAALVQGHGDW